MEPSIREVNFSDCEAVGALKVRNGLKVKWSIDRWECLWQKNPAWQKNPTIPIGWVLEENGNIVGYLGNIPLYYHYHGKRLLAAAARGFAVDTKYRSQSLRLAVAFFTQKNIELLLNTSANEYAGNVFKLCKAEKIPYKNYDKALFWIINARGFACSVLRKFGCGKIFAAIGGGVLATPINLEGLLRGRGPVNRANQYEINILEPNSIGSEFDEFWHRILSVRSHCLLAERSAEALRWHFGNRVASMRQAKIVCARLSGKLVGYTVITREDSDDIGFIRSRIVDLMTENEEPGLIDALLLAAFKQAHSDGSHILEMIGFPEWIRTRLVAGSAYKRQIKYWQFWYKAVSLGLHDVLKHEDDWYGSSYDGDASL